MNLHGKIMNIPAKPYDGTDAYTHYCHGHRDARHAAAELALKVDACVDALRTLDARLRECAAIPASAADAYDSFYQELVADALAAVGDA